ncbi:hypothetical protein Slin15195_G094320 [Septoria linicola]|uniref:Uncharacterized protein n=1 Tax=Septoria linicola TaxID=215465 RepID=A0A9Q9B200_9PEZI|nr:hypothetical protein Slin15195_G094320 [Septoria linicola]
MSFKWMKSSPAIYCPVEKSEESSRSLTDGNKEGDVGQTAYESPQSSRNTKARELVQFVTCVLCVCILFAIGWQSSWHLPKPSSRYESKTLTCGNSTSDAKARGCVFDLLANNWVAPQCLDPYTESEYRSWLFSSERAHGPFPFFFDIEGTNRVPNEHSLSLRADGQTEHDRRVYTTREQHLNHCGFVLKRLHRSLEGKTTLNDEHGAYAHTEHCVKQLNLDNHRIMGQLVEECYIGYSTCTIEVPV